MVKEHNAAGDRSEALIPQERRRHPRYPFTAGVELIEPNSKTRIEGRTTDLSYGGCYVDTIISLPIDTTVEMCLTKENRCFKTKAKVAYSADGLGMGVKFIPAGPDQIRTLESWIGQLNGKLVSEPEVCEAVKEPHTQSCPHNESLYVLNELIIELGRQGILTDLKCKALIEQLHCSEPVDSNSSKARMRPPLVE